ncbi:ABC transporter ATP-binding protein [Paralimibaculum aggregatum]|uniref:Spermidine/putrescine import ATP-binding protein PotA n=1 Tax=Paralimibaculum aggregatum TaxID=3036245 RepID=A0ABQ6LK63_9RHOB|nr:ABC transporter ATP-binding protein [Limibaculum sp. NKW23]GMG80796.1 ABC transporter ATP-binding protein [Limibaculum sp. NKW23]
MSTAGVQRKPAAATAGAKPWADPAARPYLEIAGVTKRFGSTAAVDRISLGIHAGEFFALLGPSGCGKTTLLRMLAGFETPDEGSIRLDGEELSRIPPHERPVNMMFQSYALFPHMTVEKNIAFGLEMERMPAAQRRARVEEMLALTRLEKLARRRPDQLSGGQRQRVALARALAKKPKLILLDEPLGALDRKLREATQFELVRIQEELGLTFVIVTHDQEEAMTVSTRIAVMNEGRIAQIGEPHEVYEAPQNRFVAEFIGDVNILEGRADAAAGRFVFAVGGWAELPEGAAPVAMAVRPEKIEIELARGAEEDGPNRILGVVEDIAYLGDMSVYHVRLDSGSIVRVARTNRIRALEEPIDWDSRVRLAWDAKSAVPLAA